MQVNIVNMRCFLTDLRVQVGNELLRRVSSGMQDYSYYVQDKVLIIDFVEGLLEATICHITVFFLKSYWATYMRNGKFETSLNTLWCLQKLYSPKDAQQRLPQVTQQSIFI